jgi:hypothetical protein
MTLPRSRHACPATNSNLRPSCGARLFDRHACGRMWTRPCTRRCSPRTDLDNIRDTVPFAIQLANLLLIHLERQRDLMIVLGWFGLYNRQIERPARSRVQNAHQRSLRIAIPNVKSLHKLAPCSAISCSAGVSPAVRRPSWPPLLVLLRRFFFQQHLRKRRTRRNHRENVGLRSAIKHQQLRLR